MMRTFYPLRTETQCEETRKISWASSIEYQITAGLNKLAERIVNIDGKVTICLPTRARHNALVSNIVWRK